MKKILVAMICMTAMALSQSAPAPAPEVVPIDKEPSHHLVFENEYVRVFSVEVAPHSETKHHQHDRDYVFVTLGDSDVESVRLNGPTVHLQPKDGDAQFTKGGFAHKAVNKSVKPFRNVTVELKTKVESREGAKGSVASGFGVAHTVVNSSSVICSAVQTTGTSASKSLEVARKYFLVAAGKSQISEMSPLQAGSVKDKLNPGEYRWVTPAKRLYASIVEQSGSLLICEFELGDNPQGPSREKQGFRDDKPRKELEGGLSKDKR